MWREKLKDQTANPKEAENWETCYIGEKRIELELLGFRFGNCRSGDLYPQDPRLFTLGVAFHQCLKHKNYKTATEIADRIDAIISEAWAQIKKTSLEMVES